MDREVRLPELPPALDAPDRGRRGRALRGGGLAESRRRLRPNADGLVRELLGALARDRAPVWRAVPQALDVLPVVMRRRVSRPLQPALADRALSRRTGRRLRAAAVSL